MGKDCGSNVSSSSLRGSVAWHPERRLRRRLGAIMISSINMWCTTPSIVPNLCRSESKGAFQTGSTTFRDQFQRSRTSFDLLLSFSDVHGQALFIDPLHGPLVFWSRDNIFAALWFAKHWSRDVIFVGNNQNGITWSVFCKLQSHKNIVTWPEWTVD